MNIDIYYSTHHQQFVVKDVDNPGRVGLLPWGALIEQMQSSYACPPNMLCRVNKQGKRAANDNFNEEN